MDVLRVGCQRQVFGNVGKLFIFRTGRDVDRAKLLGLFDGLDAPFARVHVIGGLPFPQEVHGEHSKLLARAPAQKHHRVLFGGQAQYAQQALHGVEMDGLIIFAPMAHFENGHAGVVDLQNALAGFFQNGERQDRGASAEIENTVHGKNAFPKRVDELSSEINQGRSRVVNVITFAWYRRCRFVALPQRSRTGCQVRRSAHNW